MSLFVEENESNYSQEQKINEDVFELLLKNKEQLPAIRFDCGKNDLLIEYNRKLHQQLKKAKINHSYQEFEGTHEWPYWREHIKDSLLFFNQFN